jgi:putative membrane protein
MDRRLVIAGLAAVTAAPAAFAQGTSGGGTAGAATGSTGQMSQAEQKWIQQTMTTGMVALETSRIAQKKASDEDLKQFAKFEVDEQEGLAEVLKSMMPSGAPAKDAKGEEMVQKLEQERAGAGFDKAYLQGQIQGHRELLQIQEAFLKSGGQNREATNVAKLARGRIQEHIELLESLEL